MWRQPIDPGRDQRLDRIRKSIDSVPSSGYRRKLPEVERVAPRPLREGRERVRREGCVFRRLMDLLAAVADR